MPLTCSEQKIALYDLCKAFVDKRHIYEDTCIFDDDNNTIAALELVAEMCAIVGYKDLDFDDD